MKKKLKIKNEFTKKIELNYEYNRSKFVNYS